MTQHDTTPSDPGKERTLPNQSITQTFSNITATRGGTNNLGLNYFVGQQEDSDEGSTSEDRSDTESDKSTGSRSQSPPRGTSAIGSGFTARRVGEDEMSDLQNDPAGAKTGLSSGAESRYHSGRDPREPQSTVRRDAGGPSSAAANTRGGNTLGGESLGPGHVAVYKRSAYNVSYTQTGKAPVSGTCNADGRITEFDPRGDDATLPSRPRSTEGRGGSSADRE